MILILIVIIILITLFLYSWHQIRKEVHHRFNRPEADYGIKLPTQTLNFKTSDGLNLDGWYVKAANPKAVLILAHGHNPPGGKAHLLRTAKALLDKRYSSFLIDFRAVSESEGNRSTMGIKEWMDLDAGIDLMKTLTENKNIKLGLLGESGGAVTSIIAQALTSKADFVIAADPFASYKKMLSFRTTLHHFPKFLSIFPILVANLEFGFGYSKYDPEKLISKIKVPIFIAWATRDKTIGTNQGEYLFKLANEPKMGWESPTPHDVIDNSLGEFHEKLFEFLEKFVI